MNLYQVCSNDTPGAKIGPTAEYSHVAYQIKGNEAENNMLANILPLHTHLTPGVGLTCHFYTPVTKYIVLKAVILQKN